MQSISHAKRHDAGLNHRTLEITKMNKTYTDVEN